MFNYKNARTVPGIVQFSTPVKREAAMNNIDELRIERDALRHQLQGFCPENESQKKVHAHLQSRLARITNAIEVKRRQRHCSSGNGGERDTPLRRFLLQHTFGKGT